MKIIVCGPPRSGKSVFLANLRNKLPTDAYTIIRACPDGEATWSNNENQEETNVVRIKGKHTPTLVEKWCRKIDNQTSKIVLVDVGGVMSKENEQIFKHCDSFIVVSNDEKKKMQWLEFGQKLGLECVGCLDSSLEGKEEVYSRTPYFQGKIVGLERGNSLENSQVMNALVSDIIEKSNYAQKSSKKPENFDGIMIDDTELGFELGYGKEIRIQADNNDEEKVIKQVKWPEKAVPEVYEAMSEKLSQGGPVKINGIRANFMLSVICKACKEQGIKDISTYDIGFNQYVPIKQFDTKRGLSECEGLTYKIIENEENVFIDINITKAEYTLEDYENCILPKIDEDKSLYLSGRMPLWLLASMITSYDSSRIFTFQPGKGYTCVVSDQEKDLGVLVDGPDGIDAYKYFKDKQEKAKAEKYPVPVKKEGILDKIKKLFSKLKKQPKENQQYLDDSIKSVVLSEPDAEEKTSTLDEIVISPENLLPKKSESYAKPGHGEDIELGYGENDEPGTIEDETK